ncbi:type IV conjugative transfer system coupling protein TraD [Pseudohalioglobus sediminis]|uniref:Type IV conjugative transfer system coupling protein TraD n=1 Tax=Pseudohalioglobus sediminis TaxID=2606449 RepID=A0A5B0X051_9GAMM|nr:type IV conjugative transfer system coupling protein TraD [Pseudohalioglobus sediminis]KAA1192724.1 type IV conjugative transfer system coupling protein TraD [Pseudohalioglobus sediminis]
MEALLRPPVELWSTVTAFAAGILAWLAPWALMMPPGIAMATGATFISFGIWRGRQAWRVLRYQHHMKRLPEYRVRAGQIPVSRHKLFLGKGFRWTQQHTQRLRDTLKPEVQRYVQPGALYQWARQKEVAWESIPVLSIWAKGLRSRSRWNPLAPLPAVGGKPALHAVEPQEQPVWMDLGERVGHTLVLGTTRVGKTRLAELLISQDIRRGDVVIVFDPKGDADLLRRVYAEAKRAGRLDDFYLFHLGFPELSARYNAIGNFSRITEVATRIANQLPNEGNSAAFKEFAWRFVNIIARALVALKRRPDYQQIRRYINDIEPLFVEYAGHCAEVAGIEAWSSLVEERAGDIKERNLPNALRGRSMEAIACMRLLQENAIYDPVLDGLISAFKYDKTYFDKIVSSVGPLMEKLTTGTIAALISPDYQDEQDTRPIFEWMEVVRRKGIVYVGLDALTDTTVASAVGNSMFADLVSVAGYIYKHGVAANGTDAPDTDTTAQSTPTISLHADEFNELIGDEFVPLLNKAGGAGFQVTAYTQTWSDVEARIGNRAKAGQVAGNFNTMLMLRVKELDTAAMLTDQLPRVEVFTLMSVSGVDDSSDPGSGVDFKSRNEDRISVSEVPMLTAADMVTLPKGQAFALLEGGQLWKIRIPLPDGRADPAMPSDFEEMADAMRRSYVTNDHWYRMTERWWHAVSKAAGEPTASGGSACAW